MFVSQPDCLGSSCLDRENARPDQIKSDEFQKCGIPSLCDDAVISRFRLVARQKSRRWLGTWPLKRKPADRRLVWDWHEQLRLLPRRGGIAQPDFHHRGRDLLANDD